MDAGERLLNPGLRSDGARMNVVPGVGVVYVDVAVRVSFGAIETRSIDPHFGTLYAGRERELQPGVGV